MKYVIFAMAAASVFPLAYLLAMNSHWMKHAFWGMIASMCLYQSTAINFFSHEHYRGSSRGMEISLIHLLALAILLSLRMLGKARNWLPDIGFKLYAIYFILCLPSLSAADSLLISWLEIWKMLILYLFYFTVYSYLHKTKDIKSVLTALAVFIIANCVSVTKAHMDGVFQPSGVFPHRNCMAMAMLLLGPVFFAGYLSSGIASHTGRLYAIAFFAAAGATVWSYSRGAIAMMPLAYGIPAIIALNEKHKFFRHSLRIAPILIAAIIGVILVLPRVIERFVNAPKSSGDTRVELATCAFEMIKDKPLTGVGINNWSLNMDSTHPYQERASEILNIDLTYDGIVETVYLLVCAECGIPALIAMLAWFGWYWWLCFQHVRHKTDGKYDFISAGLLGGLTANYLQSTLEWVLRQQLNLVCLMFAFALISHLEYERKAKH